MAPGFRRGAGSERPIASVHAAQLRCGRSGPASESLAEPFIDLALICALVYTSGGPFSQARVAFFALPLVAASGCARG